MKENDLEIRVTEILAELDVRMDTSGFRYLRESIIYIVKAIPRRPSITKELYPHVAECFGTTAPRAERAMRAAIEMAFRSLPYETALKFYLGYTFAEGDRPSVGEFVFAVAEYMRLHPGRGD